MTCAWCVARVEKALERVPGVGSAEVNLATETAVVGLAEGASPESLVAAAVDVSRRTYAKIRQNLFWAFVYNVVGIPLAAFGILSPVIAGAAMAWSSVSVIANTLMLKRWKPEY